MFICFLNYIRTMNTSKIISIFGILFLCTAVSNVGSANILFFHLGATASHRTSIWPLATRLADSGHNITYSFPIARRPGTHPRIHELMPTKMFEAVGEFVGDFDINFRLNNTVYKWLYQGFEKVIHFCESFYDSPEIREWLNTPGLHYDLLMIDGSFGACAYPLVHIFKAKFILFNTFTYALYWDSFGVVPETSTTPEWMFSLKAASVQNYLHIRALNTVAPMIARWGYLGSAKKTENVIRKKFEQLKDMPSLEEIEQEVSLVFHNTHFIEDYPMALPPLFVSYSGLLCTQGSIKARKPLPDKLEKFVNDSNADGFMYVSFGSSVRISAMPDQLKLVFMNAFAAFPRLKFLWRWTGQLPGDVPKNVLLQNWFPQQDILAHSRIKAFVMQAGRPSAQEALCYGVPMITLPIFADQDFNADRLETIGAAILLEIRSLTEQQLKNAIQEVVTSEQYKKRLSELSSIFRDRPVDPVDNAQYWVEFVLRHNTSLLKPLGMKQTWWKRRLLDVYFFLLLVDLTVIYIVFRTMRIILQLVLTKVSRFWSARQSKQKTN